jgi:hypothetical protein
MRLVSALFLLASARPSCLARAAFANASFVVNSRGDTRQAAGASLAASQSISQSLSAGAPRNLSSTSLQSTVNGDMTVDREYPGTAVERMRNVRARVASLTSADLDGPWEDVRRRILWAGGLKDLPNAVPGQGYTGHSFNDYNHVDLTCMLDQVSDNQNDGAVKGIAIGNRLGSGIRVASLPELGPGGRQVWW